MFNPQTIVYSKLRHVSEDQNRIVLRNRSEGTVSKITFQTPKLMFWDLGQEDSLELAFIQDSDNSEALGLFRTMLIELDDKFRHDKCLSKLRKHYRYQSIVRRQQRGLFPVSTLKLRLPRNIEDESYAFDVYNEEKEPISNQEFVSRCKKGTRFVALVSLDHLVFHKSSKEFHAVLDVLQLQVFSENRVLMAYAFKDVEVVDDPEEEYLLEEAQLDNQEDEEDNEDNIEDIDEDQDSEKEEEEQTAKPKSKSKKTKSRVKKL